MNRPRPWRSAASSAAWPPAPNVQSTTVSPGRTASSRRTSSARTGMWSVDLRCKTLGNIFSTPFDVCELSGAGLEGPDLEVGAHARDYDLPAELRVLEQLWRNHHAALFVEVGLGRPGEEEPLELPRLRAERIQRGESRLDESNPILTTVGLEAPVEPARDDDAGCEGFAKLGGKSEAVLAIA